ncbi:Guanylate-binding protein 4 [Zea mays]|uniref:Guanylate-binding protein 4 n=1 Tax=Zea mays TaxID=4577 RepID=A0A3L6G0I8_MAIZE|nr:Guanylate-binding protein 4 [Zea mays]
MGRKWNELLSSAPWRTGEATEDEDAARMSQDGKVSVTSNPEEMPTMSVPRSRRPDLALTIDDFEEDEIDPELRYSFQRNSRYHLHVQFSLVNNGLKPVFHVSRLSWVIMGPCYASDTFGVRRADDTVLPLLQDFYLDLAEDNRKITPRDYLELALRPVQGGGKDISAKNAIRNSIRALFPDRECFTLVQPVNNEKDLQRLDQLPIALETYLHFKQFDGMYKLCMSLYDLSNFRSEFRSGLDGFTKFVLDRTRPKQLGASTMTGPILAGLTQSFLDAINNGDVPTISSAWQVYKRNAFLEADLQCSNKVQNMESKVRAACNSSNAKLDDIVRLLDDLLTEYESTAYGPGKWKRLATFLQQWYSPLQLSCWLMWNDLIISHNHFFLCWNEHCSLAGPVLDLFRRQLEHIDAERNALRLKCNSRDVELSEKPACCPCRAPFFPNVPKHLLASSTRLPGMQQHASAGAGPP